MQTRGAALNVLQLSDISWDRTVRLAVGGLHHAAVHQARSVPAALALIARLPPLGCIMVQADRAAECLRHVMARSRVGRYRGTNLVILGEHGNAPPGARVLTARDAERLSRILATIESDAGAAAGPGMAGVTGTEISDTLAASRLRTRYQPIVSIVDRRPLALEVLARLDHPLLGRLSPVQFMPQVEDAGLAGQLTASVIRAALADVHAHLSGLGLALSVNFPLDVLMRRDFTDWLERERAAAMLPASELIIELTESQPVAMLDDEERRGLANAMSHLRALGYRLAVDDYGPEMPRRQDLLTLPFDLLKLDKAIVNDRNDPGLVEQAVRAAHREGLLVVAEGVEDRETWARMQAIGVDCAQGYLIARPLPSRHVAEWLEDWHGRPA